MGKIASLIPILKSGAVTVPKDICTLMNLSPGDKFYIWLDFNDLINISKEAPERIAAETTTFTKTRHIKIPKMLLRSLSLKKNINGMLYCDSDRTYMQISPFCEPAPVAPPQRSKIVYLFQ